MLQRYGVTKLGLFGSTARDEAGPKSDVDIIVEMPPDLLDLVAVGEELEKAFGVKVDLVRLDDHLRPFFLQRLERDGVFV